ncbi:GGDEF domain-containing protein [Actinoplanes awajinensis]|uniref:GGDEF domain-containing protein n=1 Tax=Actinoplanes awajinensis subsp. mycoplanecinus TaxID=135947 RepID=A0A0X3V8R0_9ACTN|nr:GGDEF domain-containing protein [Actinoplanes awajinensis]KUL39656.1 hypothetical protein ADL15_08875 [Actinoplanes awajinensis subsp. mycoplanecinus]
MHTIPAAPAEELSGELVRLRAALVEERVASVRALARATRLSQLVNALGQVVEVAEVFDRAVCEVAELFGADIAAVFNGDGRLVASWGLGDTPDANRTPVRGARLPSTESPVVAGPVADFEVPGWLAAYQPRHLTCGLLTVRDESPGHLLLARRADIAFDNADLQELAAVVSRISLAVDNGRLHRRTQEQLRRSQQLHEVTADLARIEDVGEAAQRLAEAVVTHVPVTGAAVHQGGTPVGRAGTTVYLDRLVLGLGGDAGSFGTLVIAGAPAAGTLGRTFLEHLAEVGGLALEKALLFQQMREQAETDALTGLPNRSLFLQRLTTAVHRRRSGGRALSVLFADLDGFKSVNDTHGHEAGDLLLTQVAGRLLGAVGDAGTCARLGGDEFVVLCEGGDAQAVADRVREVLDEPFVLDMPDGPLRVRVGGSVGVGTAAPGECDADVLLRDADAAMYTTKQARKAAAAIV